MNFLKLYKNTAVSPSFAFLYSKSVRLGHHTQEVQPLNIGVHRNHT